MVMGAEYRNVNGKANFVLIAKEMDGKNLKACLLYNTKTGQIQRVTHAKFMYMAQNNNIMNCKASGGTLIGLQCSLRDIPAYDQTGRQISGLTEQQILAQVQNQVSSRDYKIIKKYRYKDRIVGYMVQDESGNTAKVNRDGMYKLYKKGRLHRQGYKVTIVNGDVVVSGGDIQKIPVVDVDSRGNEISKDEKIQEEQLEKQEKAVEKNIETEEKKVEHEKKEIEKAEEKVEKKANKISSWIGIELIKSKWFNSVKSCIIRNTVTGEEKDIADRPATIDKIKFTENAKKLVIEQDDIDRAIKKFCGIHNADADIQTSIKEYVSVQEAQAYSTYSQYEEYLLKVYERVKLKSDYRVSNIVLEWNGQDGLEIATIGLARGNKISNVNMEMFKQLVEMNIVSNIDTSDVINVVYTNGEMPYTIRLSTKDFDKSVDNILNHSVITSQINKKYLKDIKKSIVKAFSSQDTVGISTLYKVINDETDSILKGNVTVVVSRLNHCIALGDIARIADILENVIPAGAQVKSIYSGNKAVHINRAQLNNNVFISGGSKFDNNYIEYFYNNDIQSAGSEDIIKLAYVLAYLTRYYTGGGSAIKIRYQLGDMRTKNGALKTVTLDSNNLSLIDTSSFYSKVANLKSPNDIYDLAMQSFGTEFISYIANDNTYEAPGDTVKVQGEFIKLEYGLDLDTEVKQYKIKQEKENELAWKTVYMQSRMISADVLAASISSFLEEVSEQYLLNAYNYLVASDKLTKANNSYVDIGFADRHVTLFKVINSDCMIITYGLSDSLQDGQFLIIPEKLVSLNKIKIPVSISNLGIDFSNYNINKLNYLSCLVADIILYSNITSFEDVTIYDGWGYSEHTFTVQNKVKLNMISKDDAKNIQVKNVDSKLAEIYDKLMAGEYKESAFLDIRH
jgi:hypothetical protein